MRTAKRKMMMGMLGAAVIAGTTLGLSVPANAQGGWTQKYTPSNCTETDFSGGTSKSGSNASGFTARTNMFCGFGFPTISVRITLGSVTSGQVSQKGNEFGLQVNQTLSGAGTVTGRHTIAGYVRNS